MRFLKAQSTNARGIYGNKDIRRDINGLVTLDSTNAVMVPSGTTSQQPSSPVNGMMRYNTTTNVFESYEAGSWAPVRRFAPAAIVVQSAGNGDDSETKFGPLNNGDTYNPAPAAVQNILVMVENVLQIPTTNFTLEQNPSGYATGWYVVFGAAVPTGKPVTIFHNFDK
jgi:hypothetical protein|tara:strand:+ start:113 stop:616 length:504 start_codon:yes stop_codon:yes gene_type:complete